MNNEAMSNSGDITAQPRETADEQLKHTITCKQTIQQGL